MITETDYARILWDEAYGEYNMYARYVGYEELIIMLAPHDRLTFWLLVYASEGKELP